jgi:outer membrane protein OmpA-like peptidoglycan-associated protein
MACAECIGQNEVNRGYIFDMRRLLLLPSLFVGGFLSLPVLAVDTGDVDGSRDFPGWTRMPGFEITDYDEDNPAEFTFAISRPEAVDANHLDTVPVAGHRYVIRYEWSGSGQAPSLLKSQHHYEKLAAAAGYTIEKSGAVGDVTETFHLTKDGHEIWVLLNPSVKVNVLTIVDSRMVVPELAGTLTSAPATPSLASPVPAPNSAPAPTPAPAPAIPQKTTVAVAPVVPQPSPSPTSAADDPLGTALLADGRVVLPLTFLPGKPDLDAASKPVIERVIAILKLHPELMLTIEGHTDLSGDEDQNLILSKQRAQTVRSLLVAGHIRSKRLIATGVGGTQPVADEGTAEGREKNRRIELIVRSGTAKKQAPPKAVTQDAPIPDMDAIGNVPAQAHRPAPDGVNYYPTTSSSSGSNSSH